MRRQRWVELEHPNLGDDSTLEHKEHERFGGWAAATGGALEEVHHVALYDHMAAHELPAGHVSHRVREGDRAAQLEDAVQADVCTRREVGAKRFVALLAFSARELLLRLALRVRRRPIRSVALTLTREQPGHTCARERKTPKIVHTRVKTF